VQEFPKWYHGPEGQSGIFESVEEVPAGWHDHPNRHLIIEPGAPLPEDGPEAHGGWHKADLIAALRALGHKIHANASARSMHTKLVEVGHINRPME
jgi:hypothetical protein